MKREGKLHKCSGHSEQSLRGNARRTLFIQKPYQGAAGHSHLRIGLGRVVAHFAAEPGRLNGQIHRSDAVSGDSGEIVASPDNARSRASIAIAISQHTAEDVDAARVEGPSETGIGISRGDG